MLLVLRIVRLLADLVAIVGLAAARAHLQPHVHLIALSTSLILALLRLVEWSQLAVALQCGVAEPKRVTFQAIYQALALRKGRLKHGVLANHLLETCFLRWIVFSFQAVIIHGLHYYE